MHGTPLALAAALLLAGAEPAEAKDPAKLPEGYAWEKDFEQAKLKAAAEGKLLYVDFYTDRDSSSTHMIAATYPRDDVKKILATMICMKINPETSKANKKIADRYDVDSYPRLLVIAPSGDVLRTSKGEPPSDKFAANLTDEVMRAMFAASDSKPPDWNVVAKSVVCVRAWFPECEVLKANAKWIEQIEKSNDYREAFARAKASHERMLLASKAPAQLALGKKKEAIETWKALATTFPDTPEAAEATKQLTKLHVKLEPAEPAPEKK